MENNATPSADLQSILATLAKLSQPTPVQFPINRVPTPSEIPETLHGAPQDPRRRPAAPTPTNGSSQQQKMIDPATITTWQDGLRCVTKLAQQNKEFIGAVQRMMRDQKASEMRWYSERQALKQTQANRAASAAKAQSILQSLSSTFSSGSSAAAGASTTPHVDQDAELAMLDRKIYRAQVAMETAMCAELKGLGVPFFGTDEALVLSTDYDVTQEELPENHPKWSPLISGKQLMDLRRRIVQHLEDLYRD